MDVSPRKEIQLDWTTRRRYEWNIECEGDFESFFGKLKELRPYFYGNNEMSDFPDPIFGHSHGGESAGSHDDYHAGDFHLHTKGRIPETAKAHMQLSQGVVLLYLLIIVMILLCHVMARARVKPEFIRRQKLKYICCWTPVLLLVNICQVYVVVETRSA